MSALRSLLLSLALVAPACAGHHAARPADVAAEAPVTPIAAPIATPIAAPTTPVDAASVTTYLTTRFAAQLRAGTFTTDFGMAHVADDVVGELKVMGIARIDQLAAIVPPDFEVKAAAAFSTTAPQNAAGLLRDLLIIHDAPRYFTTAWNNHWVATSEADFAAPIAYGLDVASLAPYGVIDGGDSDEGDDAPSE